MTTPSTSNSSDAAAAAHVAKSWVQAVQMLHEAYVYPFFVVAGVFSNALIAVAFSLSSARLCGSTTRIYYVLIALADTVRLVEWDLAVNFVVSASWPLCSRDFVFNFCVHT